MGGNNIKRFSKHPAQLNVRQSSQEEKRSEIEVETLHMKYITYVILFFGEDTPSPFRFESIIPIAANQRNWQVF